MRPNALGRVRALLAALVLAALAAVSSARVANAADLDRIGGADRYDTMDLVARAGFKSADTILVTSGEAFPDALSASGLAGASACPVVLTPRDRLPAQVLPLASALGARRAIIVGGTSSVSEGVASSLRKAGISVERVAGADRVSTSVEAMRAARAAGSASDTVVVASGDSFADTLSIGPWCWRTATPIVLARGGAITGAAADAIRSDARVRRVVIVGGKSAVSDDVIAKLGDSYEYVRLGGADLYETSAGVAAWCCANGLDAAACGLATGANFPDSLAASSLLGGLDSPLLLAAPGHADAAKRAAGGASQVIVLGGEGALPASVANEVAGKKQESAPSSFQLRYGRERCVGYPNDERWYTAVAKPGATEIPRTLADYRSRYGAPDTEVRHGGNYALTALEVSIPGTNLKVSYVSPSVDDERYATAMDVYGSLGELVSGLDTSPIALRDFVGRIEAPYQYWSNEEGDVEICGSCAMAYYTTSSLAAIIIPMEPCESPDGYSDWESHETIGLTVDVAADGTVSAQSGTSLHVIMWTGESATQ